MEHEIISKKTVLSQWKTHKKWLGYLLCETLCQ